MLQTIFPRSSQALKNLGGIYRSNLHPSPRFYNRPRHRQPNHHQNQNQTQTQLQTPQHLAPLTPPQPLLYVLTGYFTLINLAAIGLFYYDKHQALKRGWRIPEKQLQLTALLGGWLGGMWAMKTFRHKTVKQSFKEPYLMCVAGNVIACVGAVAAWRFNPGFRMAVMRGLGRPSAHI